MEKLVILIFLASLMVNKGIRGAAPPPHFVLNFFFSVGNVCQVVPRALLLKYNIFFNKHCN